MAHLKVHPTYESKHAVVRTMHLVSFHIENPPKQVFVGHYPQEGLTHDDKARQLRHRIRRKELQLDSILTKEATEEVRRWDCEPALVEVGE
jgi:hypothetical protein